MKNLLSCICACATIIRLSRSMSSVIQMYMKDADVLFIHINIMMSWQAMKQRELPCHDDEETDDEDFSMQVIVFV
mgnify:CR=1 FL=1